MVAKNRTKRDADVVADTGDYDWSRTRRWLVSGLLCLHLLAVFAAPWAEPPPSSALARRVAGLFRPYLKFASLDNGYRFFAPDPGPGHLVRYEVYDASGGVAQGVFPDRDQHWPRLLYHRHFMVAEMIFSLVGPTLDSPLEQALGERERRELRNRRRVAEELQRGVANVLLRQHENATRVRLFSLVHAIPAPEDVIRGMRLDDSALYRDVLLGEFSGAQN